MLRSRISRRTPIFLGPVRSTPFHRCIAKGIDLVIVTTIFFVAQSIWKPLGPLLGAFYAAIQDSMAGGQSIGKRIIGLKTLDDSTGLGCSAFSSGMRNLPWVVSVLCATIPVVWVFILLICIPILILETYLVREVQTGVRLGDIMANTLVVEHFEIQPDGPLLPSNDT